VHQLAELYLLHHNFFCTYKKEAVGRWLKGTGSKSSFSSIRGIYLHEQLQGSSLFISLSINPQKSSKLFVQILFYLCSKAFGIIVARKD
jgi:hypothetical protein